MTVFYKNCKLKHAIKFSKPYLRYKWIIKQTNVYISIFVRCRFEVIYSCWCYSYNVLHILNEWEYVSNKYTHTLVSFFFYKYNDSTIYNETKWNRKCIFTLIRKSHCFIFTAPMHHFFLAKNVIGEKSFLKKWVKWHLMTWIKRIDRWISKSLNGLKGDTRNIGKFATYYSLFYV